MLRSPVAVALILLLTAATSAGAQGGSPSGQYQGLFGPTRADERRPQVLTLDLMLHSGALEDDSEAPEKTWRRNAVGSIQHGAEALLTYARRRPRLSVELAAASSLRYVPQLQRIDRQQHLLSFTTEARMARSLRLQLSQGARYSPSYQLALGTMHVTAGLEESRGQLDYTVAREKQLAYRSSARLSYAPTPRHEVITDYSLQRAQFFTYSDFTGHRLNVTYVRQVARALNLRLGAGAGAARLSGHRQRRFYDLDLGLAYNTVLPFSRRTAVSFASGATLIETTAGRQVPLIGNLQLQRQLSPQWATGLVLQRRVEWIDTVSEPVLADTLGGTINGYMHSRVRLTLAPSYGRGSGVGSASVGYTSWTNQARVEMAVSRHLALFAEHFFYRYRFDRGGALPEFIASASERHAIRAGVALWAPLAR